LAEREENQQFHSPTTLFPICFDFKFGAKNHHSNQETVLFFRKGLLIIWQLQRIAY